MVPLLYSPLDYLLDPVLRGPTIGSSLMCLAAAIISVLVFLRKESLIGESLSHAAYPGVMGGLLTLSLIHEESAMATWAPITAIFGGFSSALLGFFLIQLMEKHLKTASDSTFSVYPLLFFWLWSHPRKLPASHRSSLIVRARPIFLAKPPH